MNIIKTVAATLIFLLCLRNPVWAKDLTDSVVQNGDAREFQIHIPDAVVQQKNLPVVIVMHGGGGNAAQMRQQTGMDAVADRHGFIAVYPEGTAGGMIKKFRTWNAGPCCGVAAREKIDDVGFISLMMDSLVTKYGADRTRIYATGHSNGAMMSYRLACDLSDKIAAIAPNAGQYILESCHPQRPVPVMHIHGTADPCALYNGGSQCGGCFSKILEHDLAGDKWACPPVKDMAHQRALMNGCSEETEVLLVQGALTCERFKRCPSNATVVLCSIEGAGHHWPGSSDNGPAVCKAKPDKKICQNYADATGPVNSDINASELVWSFFKGFHL